ncbi:MAG: ABC transporter ATP-binding protein [Acidimicrobiia bacterium]
MTAVVTTSELTHDYGPVVALRGVDVSIPPGVTGLVGANGAGKTTLFRILLGLIRPTDGAVTVLGTDAQADPLTVRSMVGYMPEGECLPDEQTAADFVAYSAELAGLPSGEARRRSSETLFLVGLEEERFRFLGDFSTGMRQRVKLAQAIVHDPALVLLDEPASGLDPEGREQMLALIRRLDQFGINVVVSSHVLTDIERTAHWVVLLDGGNLVRSGPLEGGGDLRSVTVEVLGNAADVASNLSNRGLDVVLEGNRMVVGGEDDNLEQTIIAAVAATDAGLIRLVRGSLSLEDEFLARSAGRPE